MNALTSRIIGTGVLFVFVFLSGVWLSNLGRPINVIILTIHKLIALGALILIGATLYQANQTAALSATIVTATVITGILFIATIITGGLVSLDRPAAAAIAAVHKVGPFLTVGSSIVTTYLLINQQP